MTTKPPRRQPYTAEEAKAIFAARAEQPTKSTREFCDAFGISEPQYYRLARSFGGPLKKTLKKDKALKSEKATKPSKGKDKSTVGFDLIEALKQQRHWRGEVARLKAMATGDDLLAALITVMDEA